MKRFSRTPAALLCTVALGFAFSSTLYGKGLDSLEANTPTASSSDTPASAKTPDSKPTEAPLTPAAVPAAPTLPPIVADPKVAFPPLGPAAAAGGSVNVIHPGLQNFYISTGLSWVNLSSTKGGWHSSTMGDVEAGYKVKNLLPKLDLFSTLRYRPITADIVSDQRAYRGIIESYLLGAKGIMSLGQKLNVNASAELGFTDTRIDSIDSVVDIDQDLEKSGVDLNLGAGVSYIVLEKIGVGTRIAFGAGAYKTLQVGLDISFLL